MTRAASIATLLAALAAAAPAASETAAAQASATIVDPATIRLSWALQLPTVRGEDVGAAFIGSVPTLALGLTMPRNAQLILRREDVTAGQPLTAPGGFSVAAGDETLTLRTGDGPVASVGGDPVLASGALPGHSAASIDVASGLLLVSTGAPALPTPAAALVIVVQYN